MYFTVKWSSFEGIFGQSSSATLANFGTDWKLFTLQGARF